ncbi:MAG: hypothetical protein WHV66_10100 [Anaerolineales bacterium]|jgi:hypothetical protein
MLPREEIVWMLYRACCLYTEACGLDAPDWIRAISGANIDKLEAAIEVARDDDTYEETNVDDFPFLY